MMLSSAVFVSAQEDITEVPMQFTINSSIVTATSANYAQPQSWGTAIFPTGWFEMTINTETTKDYFFTMQELANRFMILLIL